jgi:hypothetical protein
MEEKTERKPGERFLLWFLLALSLFIFVVAWQMPHDSFSSSGAFPLFIASVMFLSVVRMFMKDRKVFASWKWREEVAQIKPFAFPREVVVYTVVLILYSLLLYPLHFWISSYLFLVGSFLMLKGAKPVRGMIIAACMLAVIWLLFQYIFKIVLW